MDWGFVVVIDCGEERDCDVIIDCEILVMVLLMKIINCVMLFIVYILIVGECFCMCIDDGVNLIMVIL